MIDPTELELIAHELRAIDPDSVVETVFFRGRAAIQIHPSALIPAIGTLRERGFSFLASVHGLDYFPEEQRFGVHYELLNMQNADRICLKLRVPEENPVVETVTPIFPTADHQEREVFDMFGVRFNGHPDLRRILMPEDYIGHPQRRDFPIGGEPILFTHNEEKTPGWWQ